MPRFFQTSMQPSKNIAAVVSALRWFSLHERVHERIVLIPPFGFFTYIYPSNLAFVRVKNQG